MTLHFQLPLSNVNHPFLREMSQGVAAAFQAALGGFDSRLPLYRHPLGEAYTHCWFESSPLNYERFLGGTPLVGSRTVNPCANELSFPPRVPTILGPIV